MSKNDLLTKQEMRRRYPDQWLLVSDFKLDTSTTLRAGRVIVSSKSRDEIHRALKNHKGSFCIHFTGQLPKGTGILF